MQQGYSFVIPFHNEEATLQSLAGAIVSVCAAMNIDYEMIFVDDGSSDNGFSIIRSLAERNERIKGLSFKRNFGQTAALSAGIHASTKSIIVAMDADLQNDPADLPLFVEKLGEGFDVVSGWRQSRQDSFPRRLSSQCANRLISWLTGVRLHDYGCSLKAYRREYLEHVPLYGEMHRFIPVFAAWYGARVTEIPIRHHPREHGQSHYAIFGRSLRVLLDLVTVKFLHTYVACPMHFFGAIAMILMTMGGISGTIALALRISGIRALVDTPLPLLTVFLMSIGMLSLLLGLLAELLIRIYFEHPGRHAYQIHDTVGIGKQEGSGN